MIWLLLMVGVVGVLVGVGLCLTAQRGGTRLNQRRYERLRIERQTRWAERRLHDIAQAAFSAMTEEARRARDDSARSV